MTLFTRPPKFEDYAECFLAWSRSVHRPATTRLHAANIAVLLRYFRGRRLHSITTADVEAFKVSRLADRRRGGRWATPVSARPAVSPACVNRALTTLRLLFNRAAREFPRLANPVSGVSLLRERGSMRVLTRREEFRYFAAIKSRDHWDVARLMLETGMRPHEVLGLRVKDVDLVRRTVAVAHCERYCAAAVPGKTPAAVRTIPLSAEAAEVFRSRIARVTFSRFFPIDGRRSRESFLFPGRFRRLQSVRHAHNRSVERAGISPRFRLYDLRHTFATRAAQAGIALPVLAALLGHSSIQMTMRYVHPQESAMRAAIRALDLLNVAS